MIPLFTPGPVTVADAVLQAQGRPMIYHRGHTYGALLRDVSAMLGEVLGTTREVYCLSGSGTGTLETVLRNVRRPPDRVVVASNGYFGERLALQCQRLGLTVTHIRGRWTDPLPADDIGAALAEAQHVAVCAVHHETSTGRVNDLAAVARLARDHDALSVIDAISSAGTLPLDMDDHDLDVVVCTSQKGIGGTPGVGVFAASDRAWSHVEALAPCDSLTGDWHKIRNSYRREPAESQWTPPVAIMAGLQASLHLFTRTQKLADVYAHRAAIGRAVRAGLTSAGLTVWPSGAADIAPITVGDLPPGVAAHTFIELLGEVCGATVTSGQGYLDGRVVRVSHLGVEMLHVLGLLSGVSITLTALGHAPAVDVVSDAYQAFSAAAQ